MEIERTIGKLEEQGRWVAHKIETIDRKIDSILSFQWKVIGGAIACSFLATLLVELIRH